MLSCGCDGSRTRASPKPCATRCAWPVIQMNRSRTRSSPRSDATSAIVLAISRLVQMALYAMWQKHRADGVDLLVAYSQVGGVVGALAHEAEHVRTQRLDVDRTRLARLALRPIGATRRDRRSNAAHRRPRRFRRPASSAGGEARHRGLRTSAPSPAKRSVEVAHEALITQWPWLQNTLHEAAADMRILDRLMDKARRWNTTGSRGNEHLASGAERAGVCGAGRAAPGLAVEHGA